MINGPYGLNVEIKDDRIIISMDKESLKCAFEYAPQNENYIELENGEYDFKPPKVKNEEIFMKEIGYILKQEIDESGATLVTEMFDKAFEYFNEQGGEGVSYYGYEDYE